MTNLMLGYIGEPAMSAVLIRLSVERQVTRDVEVQTLTPATDVSATRADQYRRRASRQSDGRIIVAANVGSGTTVKP
jgi:hypothetical protein